MRFAAACSDSQCACGWQPAMDAGTSVGTRLWAAGCAALHRKSHGASCQRTALPARMTPQVLHLDSLSGVGCHNINGWVLRHDLRVLCENEHLRGVREGEQVLHCDLARL